MKTLTLLLLVVGLLWGSAQAEETVARIQSGSFELQFSRELYTRVLADGHQGPFEPTEYVRLGDGGEITEFEVQRTANEPITDALGPAQQTRLEGRSPEGLSKTVTVTAYRAYPGFLIFKVSYLNAAQNAIEISEWVNNGLRFEVSQSQPEPRVWSFQGASYEDRYDWTRPLEPGGGEDNFMGMNASDYGGGVPVIDAWTRDGGWAVGVLELVPQQVALPLDRSEDGTSVGLEVVQRRKTVLEPGQSLTLPTTFLARHRGDFYQVLEPYRRMMAALGLPIPTYPDSSYEPVWCSWGYERSVTPQQLLGTLDKARELGFLWAVLDDGWQTAEGDWELAPAKFPGGEAEMRELTGEIRGKGLRPKLWWAPLAVDPGTKLLEEHPEFLLLDSQGNPQKISWWDAYYLCPAYPPVQEYTRKLVHTFMTEWDFDGLKIDGQHLNAAPPCYNPLHQHSRPELSFEKMPAFLELISEQAAKAKSDAVVEVCPCGTTYALHSLPFTNQPVASDPESSFQIRSKAKTLKALMGPSVPYYGDHVELSEGGDDFASTVGVGGVIGSKFTLPALSGGADTDLTPSKEIKWSLWSQIYSTYLLPKGRYRGDLYDLGFDRPETHLIEKDNKLYYAFYAERHEGSVELRGLREGSYRVRDYVREVDYPTVEGPRATLPVSFQGYLLLEASPE